MPNPNYGKGKGMKKSKGMSKGMKGKGGSPKTPWVGPAIRKAKKGK